MNAVRADCLNESSYLLDVFRHSVDLIGQKDFEPELAAKVCTEATLTSQESAEVQAAVRTVNEVVRHGIPGAQRNFHKVSVASACTNCRQVQECAVGEKGRRNGCALAYVSEDITEAKVQRGLT